MRNRFPTLHRTTWRQRFLAIACQADVARRPAPAAEPAPRRPADPVARAAIRVRLAAITSH
jgi:hypothetical protein